MRLTNLHHISLHLSSILKLSIPYIFRIVRGLFFLISDRASKEVRNAREPDLRVA
jgi:hypothetical protein